MFNLNGFNPVNHIRWPKAAVPAAASIAIISALACGSEEPATAPQATEAPPAPAVQSIPNAAPAAGLANPRVVLPTRTPTPTDTPLPPATQIAMGTLVPVTQEPTPTPLPEDLVQGLVSFQLRQGDPITWVNHRDWLGYTYTHATDDVDITAPEFWTIGQVPLTPEQDSLAAREFIIHRVFADNPTDQSTSGGSYINGAYDRIYQHLYSELDERTRPRLAFTFAFIEHHVAPHLDGFILCHPHGEPDLKQGCYNVHVHQFEQLSANPPVFRNTLMLNPGKPKNIVHNWGPIFASAVYTVDPADRESQPIMVGNPVIEAEETILPTVPAQAPRNLIGIDVENVAYLFDCARDRDGFGLAVLSFSTPDTLAERRHPLTMFGLDYEHFAPHNDPTHQSLATAAHDFFNREICPGFCGEDFYQSPQYLKLAADLNQYINEVREEYDPVHHHPWQPCPDPYAISP